MTIGFIGLGNMARAVIGGMLDKGIVKPEDICGSAKTEATRKKWRTAVKSVPHPPTGKWRNRRK